MVIIEYSSSKDNVSLVAWENTYLWILANRWCLSVCCYTRNCLTYVSQELAFVCLYDAEWTKYRVLSFRFLS